MYRFIGSALLFVGVGLGRPAAAQTDGSAGLPARPVPFTFVTDQGKLLSEGDAKKLDGGLRSYADKTGTQVVVVTVPSLGGRSVADYGRALGTAWGVGQRGKNNGVVVLLSAQEHKVTIQPGSGLTSVITPAVTSRIINEMTPAFKQGNYFAGLRTGLNTLLVTANPSSDPRKATAGTTAATAPAATTAGSSLRDNADTAPAVTSTSGDPVGSGVQTGDTSGTSLVQTMGIGTILIIVVVIGGGLWLLVKLFRRNNSAAATSGGTPNFYPTQSSNGNQPNQPTFYPNQGNNNNGGGSGMGGLLATGAAAAAGAYLGNRLGGSHESEAGARGFDSNAGAATGAAGAAGTGAAGDYFSSKGEGNAASSDPDYFSGNDSSSSNSSGDYFSSDNSSYDDNSSGDTGGGGFDSTNDNSGSW